MLPIILSFGGRDDFSDGLNMPQGRLKAGSAGLEQFGQADSAMRLDTAAGRPLCGQGGSSLWQIFRPAVYAFVRQTCGLFARMV
ncbi:hypothetical protein ACTHSL_00720 [Neisseria sp. P0008.S010]|uniref:hypothetical protein n=1 Tax=Neisseria sp. P0008.S010 TaxID=3436707 RepID=UPI003F80A306